MKLADEIKFRTVDAGGPGSGRHAGDGTNSDYSHTARNLPGHSEPEKMHSYLQSVGGFKHYHTNSEGVKLYNRPNGGGAARLHPSGKFAVTLGDGDTGGSATGHGLDELIDKTSKI